MKVEVRVYAGLRRYAANERASIDLEIPEGATIAELLQIVGCPEEEVSFILLNGQAVGLERHLCDQAVIQLVPSVSGG
jgi:sulfur carrier protein ThiS